MGMVVRYLGERHLVPKGPSDLKVSIQYAAITRR